MTGLLLGSVLPKFDKYLANFSFHILREIPISNKLGSTTDCSTA
jgi:hypothetical protein